MKKDIIRQIELFSEINYLKWVNAIEKGKVKILLFSNWGFTKIITWKGEIKWKKITLKNVSFNANYAYTRQKGSSGVKVRFMSFILQGLKI